MIPAAGGLRLALARAPLGGALPEMSPLPAARRVLPSGGHVAHAVALVLEAGEVPPAAVLALVLRGRDGAGVVDDEVAGYGVLEGDVEVGGAGAGGAGGRRE